MKVRNPWIDPRVEQIGSAALKCYLALNGWQAELPMQPSLVRFAKTDANDQVRTITVPTLEQGRDYLQRVVEAITAIAQFENRYAVAVVDDILNESPSGGNGLTPIVSELASRQRVAVSP